MEKYMKEIYYDMIANFLDNVRDYVKGTKGTDYNKYQPYPEFLEEIDQIENELNALVGLVPDDAYSEVSE